jgi:hypothetical protein
MSDPLDTIRKAQEDRFFKLEQEKHLQAYVVSARPFSRASLPRLSDSSQHL